MDGGNIEDGYDVVQMDFLEEHSDCEISISSDGNQKSMNFTFITPLIIQKESPAFFWAPKSKPDHTVDELFSCYLNIVLMKSPEHRDFSQGEMSIDFRLGLAMFEQNKLIGARRFLET